MEGVWLESAETRIKTRTVDICSYFAVVKGFGRNFSGEGGAKTIKNNEK